MEPTDPRVRQVIVLMERHLAHPIALDELARTVNLSPSYLTVLFRRETGRSPARFWRDMRLERAQQLLHRTFLSVKEVMAAVGWNDPSHFGRDFKRKHGLPPSAVRASSPVEFAHDTGAGPEPPDEIEKPPTDD